MRRGSCPLIGLVAVSLAAGCQTDLTAPESTSLDEAYFRCNVQPVVTKLCSQFLCHGSGDRYYRVFGRNRLRFGGDESERNALMRPGEREYNFLSTTAFVDESDPENSWLLQKPLDETAGGYYHGGALEYGQGDVFATREDPDFRVILEWARGAREDPACTEPGQDL